MTLQEVKAMLDETGLPCRYHHFAEGEAPALPYIVFYFPHSDNFGADNVVYFPVNELDIELYTEGKEPDTEAKLEEVLTSHDIYFNKTEAWIEDEEMFQILYTTEV